MKTANKTKKELIQELQDLQQKYNSLKKTYDLDSEEAPNNEMEFVKAKERFRGLLNKLDVGIVVHRADTSIVSCNPKAEELLGLSMDQMLGKLAMDKDWKFLKEDNTAIPLEKYPINRILKTQESIKNVIAGVKRPSTKDVVWLQVTGYPVFDSKGLIKEVIISFIDITEQKNLENKLVDSNEFNETLISSMQEGISIISKEGVQIRVNDSFCQMTGFSAEELLGTKAPFPYWPPEEYENINTTFQDAFIRRDNRFELIFMRKTEERFPVLVSPVPIKNKHGDIISYAATVVDVTFIKHSETQLKQKNVELQISKTIAEENELRLKIAQEATNTGTWDWNLINNTMFWSDEYLKIFDLPINTIPSIENWIKCLHPDDIESVNKRLKDSLENKGEILNDYRIILSNQEIRWIRVNGKVFYENNLPVRMTGLCRDITKQKEFEQELLSAKEKAEESEEKFKAYTQFSPVAIYITDVNGNCVYANNKWLEITGLTLKDALGQGWIQGLHPDDNERIKIAWYKSLETNGIWAYEYRIINKMGVVTWVEGSAKTLYNKNKQIVGYLSSNVDINERKKAEIALKENEESYRILVENAPEALVVLDIEHQKFISVSQSAIELFKMSKDELLGIGVVEISPKYQPDGSLSSETAIKYISEAIDGGKPCFEWMHQDSEGNLLPCEVRLVRLPSENRILIRGSISDITLRKKAEKAIIESQRLNAVGEMAASIAHDFNNSLQAMMGNIEVAKLEIELPSIILEYLNNIKSIISDVADRVKSLQRFGDTKRESRDYKLVSLNKLISESIMQLRPLWKDNIEKSGFTINIETDFGNIPEVNCNEGEFKTAFYNIIKNSIEAMPKGGTINIVTGKKGSEIFVTVADTGIGMDAQTKLKIFQPFYTTKGFDVGRGLGMSGVYSIIKEYGGDIFIKASEINKGTTVEMDFPFYEQYEIEEEKVTEEKALNDEVRLRVLWVDDDEVISKYACIMVESLGHICDSANNGIHALEFLNKSKYDIVFTDIGMPEMNGWQLADTINKKFEDKIKVVIVSGWSVNEKEKNEHDIKFVLGKPFTKVKLKKIFSEF